MSDFLLVSQQEIADGTELGLTSVKRYLQGKTDKIALEPENLEKLIKHLRETPLRTQGQNIENKAREPEEARALRGLLAQMSCDEALEAGGFASKERPSIRVSKRLYPILLKMITIFELMDEEQALQIAVKEILPMLRRDLTLGNKLLGTSKQENSTSDKEDELSKLIEQLVPIKEQQEKQDLIKQRELLFENQEVMKKIKPKLDDIEEQLKTNLDFPLGLRERIVIQEMLEKTFQRQKSEGKSKFSRSEAISLFLSVLVKIKTQKDQIPLTLRIKKYESISLSIDIQKEDEFERLYTEVFKMTALKEELTLAGVQDKDIKRFEKSYKDINKYECEPVKLITMLCIYHDKSSPKNSPQKLEWSYVSNITLLESTIACIAIYLSLNDSLRNIHFLTFKDVNCEPNSLVESTAILNSGTELFVGNWVDRDNVLCNLQAIISAALQWLSFESQKDTNSLDIEIYKKTCIILSDIRISLFKVRTAFNSFKLFEPKAEINTSLKQSNQEAQISDLEDIITKSKKQLEKLPTKPISKKATDYYQVYRLQLLRCIFHAELILLRKANVNGHLDNAKILLQNLDECKDNLINDSNDDNNQFLPLEILLNVEKHLYEFSTGYGDFVFEKTPLEKKAFLEKYVSEIPKIIDHKKFYKDPGMDIYQALSEINGSVARLNFYLIDFEFSDTQLDHDQKRDILKETREQFLKASYHALRIGFRSRGSRWIAFAGRTSVRLGEIKDAEEAVKLSKAIINQTSSPSSPSMLDSILSETSLLEGELTWFKVLNNSNDNKDPKAELEKALIHFLRALKGAVRLNLNRRVSDALYNIARCSEHDCLKDAEVKNLLVRRQDSPLHELIDKNSQGIHLSSNDINQLKFIKDSLSKDSPLLDLLPSDSPSINKELFNPNAIQNAINRPSLMKDVLEDVENLLNELISNETNLTWAEASPKFYEASQNMWKKWNSEHPVATLMAERKWLSLKLKL